MGSKHDIYIAPTMKNGAIPMTKKTRLRRHTCDVLITFDHAPDAFEVLKNRSPQLNGLPFVGKCKLTDIISSSKLYPRKKKKVFKKQLIKEYGWMLRKK
jgi:hypothetical protein